MNKRYGVGAYVSGSVLLCLDNKYYSMCQGAFRSVREPQALRDFTVSYFIYRIVFAGVKYLVKCVLFSKMSCIEFKT